MEQKTRKRVEETDSVREFSPSLTTRVKRLGPVLRQRVIVALLVFTDASLAFLLWISSYVFRGFLGIPGDLSGVAYVTSFSSIAVWIALRALLGLYPGYGLDSVEKLRRHTYSVFAALGILALLALGFQSGNLISRLLLASTFLGLMVAAPILRKVVTASLKRIGLWGRPVIVLSYKGTGETFTQLLREEWGLGYKPAALFDYNLMPAGEAFEELPYESTLADAEKLALDRGIDTLIFAMPHTRREQLATLVGHARKSFAHVLIVPNLNGVTNSAVAARNIGGVLALEIKHNLLDPWSLRTKRVVDLTCTLLGGVVISPVLLLLALMVYLESGGPIFYRDTRMGRDGQLFTCLKFRTMVTGAEDMLSKLLEENAEVREEYAQYHKLRDDPRVTRAGRLLRRTSLDELPQLWNVLRGEMSLVGPRPYQSRESQEIGETQGEILRVPPGMTGPWQVSGRNQKSFQERVNMDAYYVHDWSIWLDIVLLARTLKIVLKGRGAY